MRKWVCVLLMVIAAGCVYGAGNQRKNVLFIGFDDLRPLLGCYGDPVAKTPNLDRFAEHAMVFRNAHVQQAVCSASRASFLTGCRPDTTGVDYPYSEYFMNGFMPSHPTVMKYFMDAGYYVRAFGKLHHGYQEHFSGPSLMFWGPNKYILPENQARKQSENEPFEHADVEDAAYADGQIAEQTVNTLREHVQQRGDQPFFIATGFYKPHLPWTCPKKYHDLYRTKDMPLAAVKDLPKNGLAWSRAHFSLKNHSGPSDQDGERVPDDRARELIHSYYACVSYVDAQFGKVIDELDRLGILENTIVMVWSDHGWHLGDQGMWGKSANFFYDTHVPLLVFDPSMKGRGKPCDALVEYVDMYPTLAELAGLGVPGYLEGTSLAPLLDDPSKPWKNAVFAQFPRWHQSVGHTEGFVIQTDRYRYVEWRRRENGGPVGDILGRELYDHNLQPLEAVNLAGNPEYKGIVEELSARLADGWKAALPPGVENDSDNAPAPPFVKWSGSGE